MSGRPFVRADVAGHAERALRDRPLQQFIDAATTRKDRGRGSVLHGAFGARAEGWRSLAARIKQHTLDHLDVYLERFMAAAEAAGVRVHVALDAEEANAVCLGIARAAGCRACVKSKSMVTEEIGLVPALEAAGIGTVETDLGEFVIQLDRDTPSHIVTPIIHKDRAGVARTFARELGTPYTEDPAELTRQAREYLRQKFRTADLGVSGANFLIAETGSVVICTNEGNADFCVAGPRVHIAVVGIEKLIPRLSDLPVFLKLLARSATAQPITVYTTVVTGPRKPGEPDGPGEVHVVLLDHGRSRLLREETRELLRCIRCGACLNACPVYRKAGGGHAYGAVYSGPIGAVITPALMGLDAFADLPRASSLCGACAEACPVKIDIPGQLVRLREQLARSPSTSVWARAVYGMWAWVLRSPARYRAASAMARIVLRQLSDGADTAGHPGWSDPEFGDRRWISRMPIRDGWTAERDLPAPPATSFRAWWNARDRRGNP